MTNVSAGAEFLASLERLGADGAAVPHETMVGVLNSVRADLSMPDLNKVVDFAMHQINVTITAAAVVTKYAALTITA